VARAEILCILRRLARAQQEATTEAAGLADALHNMTEGTFVENIKPP
jgi:hypothetical protein